MSIQHIDDEELIEELKRYGEKNLPTLGGNGSNTSKIQRGGRKSTGAGVQLTDQNRDTYLKKLNHYRAREKAEQNPSKYLKQVTSMNNTTADVSASSSMTANVKRRSSARFRLEENQYYEIDDPDEEEDVVEINGPTAANNTTCEYIQVNNAHTSPMSTNNTMYEENRDYEDDVVIEKHVPPSPHRNNYDNLNIDLKLQKEKIELNKTLSKYRTEIQSIISGSLIKNRQSQSPLKNEPVENTTTTLYCPKVTSSKPPSRSVFDSIKSAFTRDQTNEPSVNRSDDGEQIDDPYHRLSQIRGGHADLRQRIASSQASRSQQQQQSLPVKSDWRVKQRFSNFLNNTLMPFITTYVPYIMIAVFTIILLQYLRVVQQRGVDDGISGSGVFTEPILTKDNTPLVSSYCWDVKDIRCSQTKTLVKELIDYLRIRSGQIDCSALGASSSDMDPVTANSKANPAFIEKCIHLNTVINYFTRERALIKSAERVNEAMESVLSAVQRNPHWGLRLLNSGYMDTYTNEDVTYIMSTVSIKSLRCRFFDLVHFIYVRLVMVVLAGLTGALVWLLVRTIRKINEEREQQFFAMVSQVTNMVEKQYEMSLVNAEIKPYVAISHVYDTLVEPSQRAKKRNLWSKVVKFIEDNESRIHLETQFIDGEETHVWKWVLSKHPAQVKTTPPILTSLVGPSVVSGGKINDGIGLANSTMLPTINVELVHTGNSPHSKVHELKAAANGGGGIYLDQLNSQNMHNGVGGHVYASHQYEPEMTDMNRDFSSSTSSQNNVNSQTANSAWQGEAFNRSEKLANSPTPCLKIRNMFDQMEVDSDPMLAVRIHNDILEKCCAVQRHPVTGQTINIINENILHIVCDKKSKEGCVYVKCASNEAAGRVYQILNGVWYQGKLLNVKFLKSDRYLERFPDSALYTKPIQPIAM